MQFQMLERETSYCSYNVTSMRRVFGIFGIRSRAQFVTQRLAVLSIFFQAIFSGSVIKWFTNLFLFLLVCHSGDSGTRATRAEPELLNDDRGDSGTRATRAEPKLRNDGRLVII